MHRIAASILLLLLTLSLADARSRPNLVPPGWQEAGEVGAARARRYVSPDGAAWMEVSATSSKTSSVVFGSGADERVTYRRQTRNFIALSGYRGDRIFYRKSNLACGGTRWHSIELEYPISAKRSMDAIVTKIAHGMNRYDDDCRGKG